MRNVITGARDGANRVHARRGDLRNIFRRVPAIDSVPGEIHHPICIVQKFDPIADVRAAPFCLEDIVAALAR
jgi:hypothetical protein